MEDPQVKPKSLIRHLIMFLLLVAGVICLVYRLAAEEVDALRTIPVDHGTADPAVSPDGREIAAGVFGKVWLIPFSGGEARQVTDGLGWDSHPAWSPDGQFLAYAHQLPGGSDLVVLNLATGGSNILYHTANSLGQITYHPQGGEIFFIVNRSQYDSHIWRISTSGGEPKQVTFTENWHEWSFALSPDGKEILLDSGHYGGSNLFRIRLDGMQTTRLTRTPLHQTSVGWSRDGKIWVYVEAEDGVEHAMIQQVGSSQARSVFSSPFDQKQLVLHPDGVTAVLCAGRRLYRLSLTSGQTTPISFVARFKLPSVSKPDLVVTNARLFDGVRSDAVANVTIEIRNGRIASIRSGQAASVLPAHLPLLDAAGRTVLPGLMDSHYHYWNPFDGSNLLSRGVTSIRDVGSALSSTMNFKESIALGILPGPDMYVTGPLIDGMDGYHPLVDVELSKAEAAAPLVRALKSQGVDALKVYFLLNPDVLAAVVKEAHVQGLPVTGHIGVHTGWSQAMEAGIDGLNHVRVWRDFLPLERQPQGESESLDASRNLVARMQADWSEIDPDGPGAERIIKMMLEKKVGFDPTLAIQKIEDPLRKLLSLEQFPVAQDSYKRMGRFVQRAQKMGVLLLAGTDNVNLFDELEAYAEAGIPNAEILKSATMNGAKWVGKQSDFGTVEVGKRANLVLVDGDPLKDMKDIRKISAVVKDGYIVFRK